MYYVGNLSTYDWKYDLSINCSIMFSWNYGYATLEQYVSE